jgi:hypothetical protein
VIPGIFFIQMANSTFIFVDLCSIVFNDDHYKKRYIKCPDLYVIFRNQSLASSEMRRLLTAPTIVQQSSFIKIEDYESKESNVRRQPSPLAGFGCTTGLENNDSRYYCSYQYQF